MRSSNEYIKEGGLFKDCKAGINEIVLSFKSGSLNTAEVIPIDFMGFCTGTPYPVSRLVIDFGMSLPEDNIPASISLPQVRCLGFVEIYRPFEFTSEITFKHATMRCSSLLGFLSTRVNLSTLCLEDIAVPWQRNNAERWWILVLPKLVDLTLKLKLGEDHWDFVLAFIGRHIELKRLILDLSYSSDR